ncbi:CPBP family intramembrane glutamic endopeptidase [Ruania halotolerans]|uniref:CPBP family intramembrane glutamic endopeptidase n=1 Tax=Ruania halotolerans TaxID=2897773 RepID=UPI001E2E5345|nr:type II CAAX endopeptidase family protein [Ruania halotolerans]UFU06124.1 CPBP family intramembrane metalloprotease [Ruania halotolerans]
MSEARLSRRRVAVALTVACGSVLLWWSLALRPGDPLFYLGSLLLAGVWLGGSLASGPLRWRPEHPDGGRRLSLWRPVAIGLALLAVFCVGALVVARVPTLTEPVQDLLDHARYGALPVVLATTVVSGFAEELFFRGALFHAVGSQYAVPVSTMLYTLSTVGSGVPLLIFAAAVLGLVCALYRRATGGVLGAAVIHIIWSSGMLLLLPPLLERLA